MKSDVREYRLPASFFMNNRKKLAACLPDRFVAVLFAGNPVCMSGDSDYPFYANRNFYYFAGIEQEESVLVLLQTKEMKMASYLFIQIADERKERWLGKRLTKVDANTYSDIDAVMDLPSLDDFLLPYISDESLPIALETNLSRGPGKAFEKRVLSQKKERELISLMPIISKLRMIKEPCEIEMIRMAIQLTGDVIRELIPLISPGVSELTLTSSFDYFLARRGCLVPAFPTIIAAGENALCLHHMTPSGAAREGDLIQIDVGGRVGGLCADISRVFPVVGEFSARQLALYQAVIMCQKAAVTYIRPGVTLAQINDVTRETAKQEIDKMGLFSDSKSEEKDVSKYYWHSVSHHLGHDVHDVSDQDALLSPGMVLTVEPGLYIPEWGMGFRIEDDVLVTSGGCEALSDDLVREANDICAQMNHSKKRGE